MNGNKGLLDSNVIIDASKGIISIEEIVSEYENLYTSLINYIEVLGYNFSDEKEEQIIIDILNSIPIFKPDMSTASIAIDYRKKSKIKLPDALILATTKQLKADLITRNIDDFKNVDNSIKIKEPKVNETSKKSKKEQSNMPGKIGNN